MIGALPYPGQNFGLDLWLREVVGRIPLVVQLVNDDLVEAELCGEPAEPLSQVAWAGQPGEDVDDLQSVAEELLRPLSNHPPTTARWGQIGRPWP